jgi:prolactin regulatory element-binding protein
MTRTAHYPHPTPAYPVYALDWVSDDTLLLAGGGGATKSGIDNKLVRGSGAATHCGDADDDL